MIEIHPERPTPWHKQVWFLSILNALSVFLVVCGHIYLSDAVPDSYFVIGSAVSGAIFGGILGYSVWASDPYFPKNNIFILSLLWGVVLGFITLSVSGVDNSGAMLLTLPIVACPSLGGLIPALLVLLETGRKMGNLFMASLAGIFGAIVIGSVSQSIGININFIILSTLGGGIYGMAFAGLIRRDNIHQMYDDAYEYHLEYERGYMPEGEFVIGDDGELVEVSEVNQQNIKH